MYFWLFFIGHSTFYLSGLRPRRPRLLLVRGSRRVRCAHLKSKVKYYGLRTVYGFSNTRSTCTTQVHVACRVPMKNEYSPVGGESKWMELGRRYFTKSAAMNRTSWVLEVAIYNCAGLGA